MIRPHLVRWQKEYAERGLLVIEITRGKQEPLNVVKKIVEKQRLNHPVLWDWKCRNHDNYGLKAWPVSYLIDTKGKVFWEGNPARFVNRKRGSAAMRKLIESKLAEGGNAANSEGPQSPAAPDRRR